jgi:hypothetical protein
MILRTKQAKIFQPHRNPLNSLTHFQPGGQKMADKLLELVKKKVKIYDISQP